MKHLIIVLAMTLAMAAGCRNRSADNTVTDTQSRQEIVAGDVQKTWKAKRETDAQGNRDRLDREERDERVTFYRNGNVTMTGATESIHGKWVIEGNRLLINVNDSDVNLVFEIIDLAKNNIELRAEDNSTLRLKPE